MAFVADLGSNLAPKFIDEVDGGVGGRILARGWSIRGYQNVALWLELAVRNGGTGMAVVGGA